MLNRIREYYENNKERLRQQARNEYRELCEKKDIKREYGRNRYENITEENKQSLKEYQKIILKIKRIYH